LADLKISQLTDGGASQAADEYVIARSGSNYRIDGASVAAAATSVGTLTSLTVSGNLTVDTNTLFVDATNNAVGAGTTSPNTFGKLATVAASTATALYAGTGTQGLFVSASDATRFVTYASSGSLIGGHRWLYGNTEGMRLDDSGNLGLGVTPSAWTAIEKAIEISRVGNGIFSGGVDDVTINSNAYYAGAWKFGANGYANRFNVGSGNGQFQWFVSTASNSSGAGANATFTQAMTLDASGNLGVGVTPSAWASTGRAVQVGSSRSSSLMALDVGGTYYTILGHNWYYDGANDKYISTDVASRILQHEGIIRFQNAASGTAGNNISFTERARIRAEGDFLVGTTNYAPGENNVTGHSLQPDGLALHSKSGGYALLSNRKDNDGTLVSLRQDGNEEGTISVSGNTVSYNAFAGSHWSQLEDGSKPEILRGTVMEALNELCEWPNEQNERLPKAKVSDTAGSKKVYGVFMAWDNDWTVTNDMYVTAVGAFICRVAADVVVEQGDLLESNGDGTARVQADDVIRSSTIGKVTSTVKTHEYEDGTYCVPTVLYCG